MPIATRQDGTTQPLLQLLTLSFKSFLVGKLQKTQPLRGRTPEHGTEWRRETTQVDHTSVVGPGRWLSEDRLVAGIESKADEQERTVYFNTDAEKE